MKSSPNTCHTPSRLSRRSFLGAAAAAAIGAPRILRADDKAGAKPIIVGRGEHTYEMIHDWGELPASLSYGNTHGVCEDAQGRIYIKHTVGGGSKSSDAVVVFDENGKFIRAWGAEFKGGAHGLHYSKESEGEFLYLCDQARGVMVKAALDGTQVYRMTCPMESGLYRSPAEYHPTNVAIGP